MRTVTEWIGAHDDQAIPDRVKLRIFERYKGICQLSQRKITPADKVEYHHRIPLSLGGQHREGNIVPVIADDHKKETALNMKAKAKSDRIRKRHIGIKKPRSRLSHPTLKRTVSGQVVDRKTGRPV